MYLWLLFGVLISLSPKVVPATLCPRLGVFGVQTVIIYLPRAIAVLGRKPGPEAMKHTWTALQAFCGGGAYCTSEPRYIYLQLGP